MNDTDCDVVVIGAGISGLTAAFLLARQRLRVELIEAAPRVGGVIGTVKSDGVLYERGPNSILETSPLINKLITDAGIAAERIEMSARAKNRFVVRQGRLVPLPLSPAAFITTPLFSAKAKLRLLKEPFVGRGNEGAEESVSQFVTRRLGRDFLDYAVEPFVAGIYAGDPDELSVAAAFPRLHALEQRYGSLLKGQIPGASARARERGARGAPKSFSFADGMQTLPEALARAIGPVRLNTRATRITRTDTGVITVGIEHAGTASQLRSVALVLAVPAERAAMLVRGIDAAAAQALEEIPYARVASVARAYARGDVAHALDGFGFLVPRLERRRVLGALFSSSMFEGRAAPDTVLLTTFVGGRRNPELASQPAAEIERIVADELAQLLQISGPERFSAITQWPRAIPQYTLGHRERVAAALRVERAVPGLFLCASYRGGISVGDCIQSAHRAADTVRQFLRS